MMGKGMRSWGEMTTRKVVDQQHNWGQNPSLRYTMRMPPRTEKPARGYWEAMKKK